MHRCCDVLDPPNAALQRLLDRMPSASDDQVRYFEYVIDSIEQGLADVDEGRTISHDAANARLRGRWRSIPAR
ncbi:MAG: hypothetical protein ACTHU0_38360 [Kofleriaceae bacterium]